MGYLSVDVRCAGCGSVFPALVDRETPDELVPCVCGAQAQKTISAPTVLKASWPDGYREQNNPDFIRLKEASKLECELARKDANRKPGEIKGLTEINSLKKEIDTIKKAPAKGAD